MIITSEFQAHAISLSVSRKNTCLTAVAVRNQTDATVRWRIQDF